MLEVGCLDIEGGQRGSGTLGSRELSPQQETFQHFLPRHPRWPPQLAQGSWAPAGAYLRTVWTGSGGWFQRGAETPLLSGAGAGERLGGSCARAQAHEDVAPTCPGSGAPATQPTAAMVCGMQSAHTLTHKPTQARTRCSSPHHACTSPHRHAHAAASLTTRCTSPQQYRTSPCAASTTSLQVHWLRATLWTHSGSQCSAIHSFPALRAPSAQGQVGPALTPAPGLAGAGRALPQKLEEVLVVVGGRRWRRRRRS